MKKLLLAALMCVPASASAWDELVSTDTDYIAVNESTYETANKHNQLSLQVLNIEDVNPDLDIFSEDPDKSTIYIRQWKILFYYDVDNLEEDDPIREKYSCTAPLPETTTIVNVSGKKVPFFKRCSPKNDMYIFSPINKKVHDVVMNELTNSDNVTINGTRLSLQHFNELKEEVDAVLSAYN